eukprot:6600647-Pyramimonas_sp.AAC.1
MTGLAAAPPQVPPDPARAPPPPAPLVAPPPPAPEVAQLLHLVVLGHVALELLGAAEDPLLAPPPTELQWHLQRRPWRGRLPARLRPSRRGSARRNRARCQLASCPPARPS